MALILTRQDVQQVLTMRDCIETIAEVMQRFSAGDTVMPVRLVTRVPERGVHAAMPAVLPSSGVFGIKSITVFPTNPSRGAPTILGLVILNETETGRPLAVMDAGYLTGIRTAAASAVATRLLARPESSSLALIGAGVQAATHLWGMSEVRPVKSVAVYDIDPKISENFIQVQTQRFPEMAFRQAVSPEDAIRGADLVCTISSSKTPVVDHSWVKPGAHINGVGSHSPEARELDGATVQAARVAVDSREGALKEAGDFIIPMQVGLFGAEHVSDEIGELLAGLKPGRTSPEQITLYKSVGIAVQDVATARLVYERAAAQGVGVEVEL
jgi:alanine dehydrogenase